MNLVNSVKNQPWGPWGITHETSEQTDDVKGVKSVEAITPGPSSPATHLLAAPPPGRWLSSRLCWSCGWGGPAVGVRQLTDGSWWAAVESTAVTYLNNGKDAEGPVSPGGQ